MKTAAMWDLSNVVRVRRLDIGRVYTTATIR